MRYTSKKSISGVAKGLEQANTQSLSLTTSDYQSHYNTKLGKCLMLIEATRSFGKEISNSKLLTDAFERRVYAYYLWTSKEGKNYWGSDLRIANSRCRCGKLNIALQRRSSKLLLRITWRSEELVSPCINELEDKSNQDQPKSYL